MPLPEANTSWPPKSHGRFCEDYRMWSAWYEGDRELLARVYGGAAGVPYGAAAMFFGSEAGDHISQYRGGVVGAVARWFWGQPLRPEQRSPKLHVPLAADIASTSANLLFGEQPDITFQDTTTQDRLEELFDETAWAEIINAAELCAGLGGVFIRVAWDQEVSDRPLLSVLGPDIAIPTFRWGKLSEVTFYWVLERGQRGEVLRHLEHHAAGTVEHALYLGDDENLGRIVPLTEHRETASLSDSLNEDGVIPTGLPGLDVVYVKNIPHRGWRNNPVGQGLGQPDIHGVEPLLDSLDETYTSWMRDLRLAKTRIVVPQNQLETAGRGRGASFDMDREVFIGMNALISDGMPVELIQPAIRDEQHARTAMAFVERVIAGAGYSAQTFGLTGDVAMTATEANARERKTVQTRNGKIRRWRPALADLIEIMLMVDSMVFNSGVTVEKPDIEFAPIAHDNPEALAQTSSLLRSAEAASTETLVKMNHPDWDADQVREEILLIMADKQSSALPNPDYGFAADGTQPVGPDGVPGSASPNGQPAPSPPSSPMSKPGY